MKTTEFYVVDVFNDPATIEEFLQHPEVLSMVRDAILKDVFWNGWLAGDFIVSTFAEGLEDEVWAYLEDQLLSGDERTFEAFRVKVNFEVEKIESITVEGVESEEEAVTCCSTCGKEL